MENKWEYDYSNLYGSPSAGTGLTPPPTEPGPAFTAPQPPQEMKPAKKHKGRVKKVLGSALALVLVAAVGFGGGWAGYLVASSNAQANNALLPGSNTGASQSDPSTTVLPSGSADGDSLSMKDVSAMVQPSVVVITTEKVTTGGLWGQYVESGAGSGVVMSNDGYIITNNHVVEGATNVLVTTSDGTEYTGTVVGSDSQSDIAVVKVDASGLKPAVMGDSDSLAVGEEVLAVGNPLGNLGGTVTNGIISALNRTINVEGRTMTLIQTNAAVSPGNSGGGLFNMAGQLVGIVNAKSNGENAEGLGFAIPVNTARQVAQELVENGYVTGRPALGVTVISGEQAAQYFGGTGVYIVSITEGGAAETAGLKSGDRIVSVDGQLVESTTDLTNILSEHTVGDTVELQISRNRQLYTVQVTLGEKTE